MADSDSVPGFLPLGHLLMGLSLGTDMARDAPWESALRTALFSLEIGAAAGLQAQAREVYYVALLRFVGCTAYAHELTHGLGADDREVHQLALLQVLEGRTARSALSDDAIAQVVGTQPHVVGAMMGAPVHRVGLAASQCEVAARFARRLRLDGTASALLQMFERYDGSGLGGDAGDAIAPAARVVQVGYVTELALRMFPVAQARTLLSSAAGEMLDPELTAAALEILPRLEEMASGSSVWAEVLPQVPLDLWSLDDLPELASVFGDLVDLKSVYRLGHSRSVSSLAVDAAQELGLDDQVDDLRVAGLLHDLGLLYVSTAILDKPGPLAPIETERVRLHPYYTERVLNAVPGLERVAALAAAHHERLDGSGYRPADAPTDMAARVLAVADVYSALQADRAYRPGRSAAEAGRVLAAAASDGVLDPTAVAAVLTTVGSVAARDVKPVLTPRQMEVLGLIAIGQTEKQVASILGLSSRTVHHHVSHIYERIGVSTRAAAALYAVENGLVGKVGRSAYRR